MSVNDYNIDLSLSQVEDSLDLDPDMRLTIQEFLKLDNA